MEDDATDALLALDGASFELTEGFLVEFSVRKVDVSEGRPHGLRYALVFRAKGGTSIVRFDNAHEVSSSKGGYARRGRRYDHWHRTEKDRGRPYSYFERESSVARFLGRGEASVGRARHRP